MQIRFVTFKESLDMISIVMIDNLKSAYNLFYIDIKGVEGISVVL